MARAVCAAAVVALSMAACGGDDDSNGAGGAAPDDAAGDAAADAGGSSGGGGSGQVVLGGETIMLDSSRCFLQEQDAAAGGGKILFTAQGFGTDAAGDEVVIDVSRYDEDSQFEGDDVVVHVGDVLGGTAVTYASVSAIGTVTLDGSTVRAESLALVDNDDLSEVPASFEISC